MKAKAEENHGENRERQSEEEVESRCGRKVDQSNIDTISFSRGVSGTRKPHSGATDARTYDAEGNKLTERQKVTYRQSGREGSKVRRVNMTI